MEIDEEDIKQQMQEMLVQYFLALTGCPDAINWLLLHPEQNLRELGELMIKKQSEQPQRQKDGYEEISISYNLQE